MTDRTDDPLIADDPLHVHAAVLCTELRLWLRAREDPPVAIAAALCYELAALAAHHAVTEAEAIRLIDFCARRMKTQIQTLGIGGEHP